MSNTSSNKTSKTNKQTVKVIVGEIGRDTKTGILGRGYSYDNGATFHVTDTMFGRLYDKDDGERMWPNMAHKVADEIKSATADLPNVRKQADSAVKFAESAIAASKVNSDAIVAQSSAVVEAKSAMDSATAEIQQTAANAASDAAKIRADVARVQSEVDTTKAANSASVEALKSDINTTKQDLATVHDSLTKAQAAAEQNQKAINDSIAEINANVDATNQDLAGVRKDLTKAQSDIIANQKAVNDNVAQINSDIEQDRKDIASAQQANADTVKQLDAYSKQAQEQGKTIKAVQDKQDGFSATLADVQGNVSQVSDKVSGLSASLKDAQDNVASVKAQADQLSATLTDHSKSIAILTASAKELSSTLEDADGRLSKVEQTAQTNSSTLSDVQGDLSQVKQDATTLTATLKDAQGNISTLQQKADSVSAQLASAQGDIATLQTGVDGVKATLTSHDKSIHTLQADSKSLKDSMTNAQGDISTLQKSATSLDSEISSQDGRLSKVEQTATEHSTTISNLLSEVEWKQVSNTTLDTMKSAGHFWGTGKDLTGKPGNIKDTDQVRVVVEAPSDNSVSQMLYVNGLVWQRSFNGKMWSKWVRSANQGDVDSLQGNISQVKQTADGLVTTLKDAQGNIDQLQQTAKGTAEQISSLNGDITSLQKDVNGIKLTIVDHDKNIHTLQADSKSLHDDMEDAQGNISSLQKTSTSLVSEFKDHDGRLSKIEQTATEHTSELADAKGNIDKVTQKADNLQLLLSDAQKNIQNIQLDAKGLHDTLTGQDNQLASLNVTLNNLDSKYSGITGDLKSKQTALSTEQQQTKDMLLNKADKSEVDSVKGTVNQVSAEQKTMADQISQKVSSAEYQTLRDKVNGMKIGTRNLLHHSDTFDGWHKGYSVSVTADKYLGGRIAILGGAGVDGGQLTTDLDGPYDNQPVTWTVYAKADNAGDKLHTELWGGGGVTDQPLTTEWKTYKFSGHRNINHPDFYLWGCVGNKGNIYVALPFAVVGNYIGTWLANPDDTITAISKNTTAIDENSKLISLMAKQTEVDNVKNTAQQISSRLDILAGEVKSKVDETWVNNIVDGKGYATTSTVQSLITQTAGTINESITNLTNKVNSNNGGGVNLLQGTAKCEFSLNSNGGTQTVQKYDDETNYIQHTSNTPINATGPWIPLTPEVGQVYTFSADVAGNGYITGDCFRYEGSDSSTLSRVDLTDNWQRISNTFRVNTVDGWHNWIIYANNSTLLKVKHIKIERGSVATPWTPAPSDNATVTQVQSLTASIDGLQSTVANKADQSAVTQLANTYQIKLTGNLLASLGKKAQKYTVGNNTFFPFASIDVTKVTKGTVLTLSFDYSSDADCAFAPQLDGTPWVPWGDIKDNPISVKANVPGHYVKQITVGDDSWTKGTAKNIAIRIDNFGGTFTVSNLTLRSGDNVASTFDMLQYDMDLRVQKGELLSQINLTAGNTLIQSNKLYLDASSVVFSGRAFIPSAAIASLSADKINTGWLNTNNVNLGDGRTRIIADHDYMYIQPTGSAASNTGIRMGYSGLDFLTNVIPNGYSSSVPYYSVGYDGAANGYFKISAFDHINPGGATATQNWFTMYDAISLNNKEVNIAANNKPRIRVTDNGIEVRPTIFFNNENYSGTWAGFTRLDNKDVVEFNTGNNDGENFHVNSGARFMKYVYFNDYCRAQGWLTYSTLSKKTNIKKLDTSLALDKIRQDDQYLYEYKRNVAKGVYDPQASFIIDDVNDVSHYSVPREFIDQTGKYREPSVELSYLIAAFQEIDKQVQKQKEEIKELKEKLQHE